MIRPSVLELLQTQILLSDGSIGTELQRRGLDRGASAELWNIEHPEVVKSLHRAYLDAGARFLTTNSFRGNRLALCQYQLKSQVEELNRTAAELARKVAGDNAWVMGSIGPFGGLLQPFGETSPEDAYEAFKEQAGALLKGGVDIILIETMSAVEEVEVAIRAARKAGAAVVFSTMTFARVGDAYQTMMGVSSQRAVETMEAAGADVIGCNCGTQLEMKDHEQIVRTFRACTRKPIMVQPNAGQPEFIGTEIVYRRTPESMAASVPELVQAGANIVGGCCGTTPEHIRSFGRILRMQSIP
jgi:5-methyltetrahydrofolate--homocysteine methyltransferase